MTVGWALRLAGARSGLTRLTAAVIAFSASSVQFLDPAAKATIERSRAAVAAKRSVDDIRTMVLRGRLRIPVEHGQPLEGTTEIKIALPDRYLRVDSIAASRGATDTALAKLLLGMAAIIHSERATVKSSADEGLPGTHAVDVGAGRSPLRLVVDDESGMPLRIVDWSGSRGTTVMSFADRRDVDGFLLPHRVTTTTTERVLETLMFDEIRINSRLTEMDFKP